MDELFASVHGPAPQDGVCVCVRTCPPPPWTDTQLAEARQRFPLLYDNCLPGLPPPDSGKRCAVVCDTRNTVLAVLQQDFPFRGGVVYMTALAFRVTREASRGSRRS